MNVCSPAHPDHLDPEAGYCCGMRSCRHECCRDTFYDRLPDDHPLIVGPKRAHHHSTTPSTDQFTSTATPTAIRRQS